MTNASISIIIPAFNEENYLAKTLLHINRAIDYLQNKRAQSVELVVVDNNSTDRTASIAQASGATVLSEPIHNIARVKNTGARAANGDILVFVDADTLIPETLLWRISQVISEASCVGGAVDTEYRPAFLLTKLYLQVWRFLGKVAGMAQGATQFCQRGLYFSLGGYDETLFMGEDVDFFWRLSRSAKKQGLRVCSLSDVRVASSCRRFDQWPFWKVLIWTNPFIIFLLRRLKRAWSGWYQAPPR